jgi:hypothetical protein
MIVVHKYISRTDRKSKVAGKAPKLAALGRALAHVKYIQHRPGEDKEDGRREFFDDTAEKVDGKDVRRVLRDKAEEKVLIHTLTLAPEINIKEKKDLAIEVMQKLGCDKGLDLEWFAIEHNNTEHYHVHVVLFGKDRSGKTVRLNKEDYKKMREFGEAYMQRWHPLQLEYSKIEREKKKQEHLLELALIKDLSRQERVKEGLELPWLHKKIVREQIEPYSQWKKKQQQKKREKDQSKHKNKDKARADRGGDKDIIEAADKQWSKDNSLKELRDLNQQLWDNYGERIDRQSYCKLVAWIKEKEEIERGGKQPLEKGQEGKEGKNGKKAGHETKEKDYLEYDGKKYSENSSYDELRGLSNKIHEPKAKRLSIDDYQSLRGWIEDADRARWQGVLTKQIELSKEQYGKKGARDYEPDNYRVPMGPGAGKMTAMFGTIAYVGRLAYEMVRIFDFSMGQESNEPKEKVGPASVVHHNMPGWMGR